MCSYGFVRYSGGEQYDALNMRETLDVYNKTFGIPARTGVYLVFSVQASKQFNIFFLFFRSGTSHVFSMSDIHYSR